MRTHTVPVAVPVAGPACSVAAWSTGHGPAVLLLHGYPETHRMWDHVVPALSDDRTVVTADLRGYGASDRPADDADHATYSKRAMADDQIRLMDQLGIERFDVVGHDRGGRVAHRLALDHPDRVRSIAVLDIVPTLHMFEHVDRAMAEAYFHWFFLTRPSPLPEQLINADLEAWMHSRFANRTAGPDVPGAERFEHYVASMAAPGGVAASCADYRAAATIDLDHDRGDRQAGRVVTAPLLALWGLSSYVGRHFDVLDVWRRFAADVRGGGLPTDHYLAEEAPRATVDVLRAFWSERANDA